jgi:hypothetical protein
VALALLGAGCGSSERAGDETTTTGAAPSSTTLPSAGAPATTPAGSLVISLRSTAGRRPSSQVQDAAHQLLTRRLRLLGRCTTCLRRDGASFLVDLPTGPEQPRFDEVLAALVAPGGMTVRPVEAIDAAPPTTAGAAPACSGEVVEDQCYSLGTATHVGVADATPGTDSHGSAILPVLTSDGIAAFNRVAARCERRTRVCATGQMAILVGGTVVAAPTIDASGFASDEIELPVEDGADAAVIAAAMLEEPRLRSWELTVAPR